MDDAIAEQSDAAVGALRRGLADTGIVAVYLYGSAVAGGLRPDSDLDLLVVSNHRLSSGEKGRIVEGLLPISGREMRPPSWRPIEMTNVAEAEVRPWRYPPRIELHYGEWLRDAFPSGSIEPERPESPDLGVLAWAMSRLPDAYRPILARARELYIDGGYGDPWDGGASLQLAERLVDEITEAAAATLGDS